MALKIGKGAAAPPFIVMDVIAAANARQAELPVGAPHVIRMEVGQPGTGAPAGAVAAVHAALRSGDPLGYTEAPAGTPLRERIVAHIRDWVRRAGAVPVARVAVTVGASGAFPLAFLAAFDPRHSFAMAAPFYPALCQHSHGSGHAAGDPGSGTGDPVPAQCGDAGTTGPAAGRVGRGKPM